MLVLIPYSPEVAYKNDPPADKKKDILDVFSTQTSLFWAGTENGACHNAVSGTDPRTAFSHMKRPNPTGPSTGCCYTVPALTDGMKEVTLT